MDEYLEWHKPKRRPQSHGGALARGSIPRDLAKLSRLWKLPISVQSLCERFGCSRATLYRHIRKLKLPLRGQGRRTDAFDLT